MSANCPGTQLSNHWTVGTTGLSDNCVGNKEVKADDGELTGPGRTEGAVLWTGGVVCDWVVKGGAPR